jgi:hypothetical protein
MAYASITFGQLKAQLAAKVNNPTMTYFTDLELGLAIQDSMRLWNTLTNDNRVNYALAVSGALGYGEGGYGQGGYGGGGGTGAIWYDLNTVADSPRIANVTDFQIYQKIQLMLIEGPTALTLNTTQFTAEDIAYAVQLKRDEFLMRTGCTRTVHPISISPSEPTVPLPEVVIEAPRAYWLPEAPDGVPNPLQKTDEYATVAYLNPTGFTDAAEPITFSAGVEAPLNVTLYPPPENEGTVEFITVDAQALLPATVLGVPQPTILQMLPDFTPAIMWGALGYLLSISIEAQDEQRASYANSRFEQFIELIKLYPFVMTARNQNVGMYADAVEVLDSYSPMWRVISAIPSVIGLAGQNLLAIPTSEDQTITLYMTANANLPVNDGDEIQLGREVLDAVLDYAHHTLAFKDGGSEWEDTIPLMKSIISLAATRNQIVKSMSIYRDTMRLVGQRENKIEAESVRNSEEVYQ